MKIFFTTKKEQNVPETWEKRLDNLQERLRSAEMTLLDVVSDQKALRDKVLRKIQFKNPKKDDDEEEDLNKRVLLPEPR